MKKIITICAALLMTAVGFLPQQASAQSPEKMSFQAVVRDGSNALVISAIIGMQISVLQGSVSGTAVYVETQAPTSNANGLVSLEIGSGTVVSGDFNAIDWANGPYFIKTETDPTGGTNYTISGTSQLLSVPYALHAKSAEKITGKITEIDPVFGTSVASSITRVDTTNWGNKQDQLIAGSNISIEGNTISVKGNFYLGQDTLGGIVFYIYIGNDGNQHGLIVNPDETTSQWQSSSTNTNANRSWDGLYNMGQMTGSPAKTYCQGLSTGGFTDWYLPSIDELSLLWHSRFHANKGLNASSYTLLSNNTALYWSSNEFNATYAFALTFLSGYATNYLKSTTYSVRAIRAF